MFAQWIFPDSWQVIVLALGRVLHQRSAGRLAILFTAIFFAEGRKTTFGWFRAAGSNLGAFPLNLWLYSLVDLWAWDKSAKVLCDRSDRPWGNVYRRPPHGDKCAALGGEVLKQTFYVSSGKSHEINKIHKQFYKVL